MAHQPYFPAIKRYDSLTASDYWMFYPQIEGKTKRTNYSIDTLPRKTTMADITAYLEENMTIAGAVTVQDESVEVGTYSVFNFIGALVTATEEDANTTAITIQGNLVADLEDVSDQAYFNIGSILLDNLTDWATSKPSFSNQGDWVADYDDNTYMVGYDPVYDIWRPILAKELLSYGEIVPVNLAIAEEGVGVASEVVSINFIGALATAVQTAPGAVSVTVNGNLVGDLLDTASYYYATPAGSIVAWGLDTQTAWVGNEPITANNIDWFNATAARDYETNYIQLYNPTHGEWMPFDLVLLLDQMERNIYNVDDRLTAARTVDIQDAGIKFIPQTDSSNVAYAASFEDPYFEIGIDQGGVTDNQIRLNTIRFRPPSGTGSVASSDMQLGYWSAAAGQVSSNNILWFPLDNTNGGIETARISRLSGADGLMEIGNAGEGGIRLQAGTLAGTVNEFRLSGATGSLGMLTASEYGGTDFIDTTAAAVNMLGVNSIGDFVELPIGPQLVNADDGTTTIDWNSGNSVVFQFAAFNETFTFTAPPAGTTLLLSLTQDGTGSRLATWPANVKWPGGTAPTLTTTATTGIDVISFYYNGSYYFGSAVNDFS